MSTAPAGGSIGPYAIVRAIGAGGWSTVHEVVGPGGARWACKRLRDDLSPEALARFRREVESLRRLDHPGVVRLIDAGVDGTAPYLVTPLIEGTSLRAVLADGPLPVEAALAVVIAAADAVAAIHAAGLVHRDLKPEHLMLTPAGAVIVIDLGLALGADHSRHTAEDALTGSVPYMAPEQIDDRALSAATDVWALGVVLFEAIAGRRPFQRARQSEEVAAILGGRSPALTELAAGCPEALAALVTSCLAASPAQRPVDGAALTASLMAQVDWTDPTTLAVERAALAADRARAVASIAATRVALVEAEAERALAAGDRFAASRAIDRGLAYAPAEPRLLALVERLMMPGPVGAAPVGRRRWPWVVSGAVLLSVALGVAVAQPWRRAVTLTPSASGPSAGALEPPAVRGADPAAPAVRGADPAAAAPAMPRFTPRDDEMEREAAGVPAQAGESRPAHVAPSRPAAGRPGAATGMPSSGPSTPAGPP